MGVRIGSWDRHGLCGKCGVYLITNTLNGKGSSRRKAKFSFRVQMGGGG